MSVLLLPWLELSIVFALVGALCVSRVREPFRASQWGLAFTGMVFVCTLLAWLTFYLNVPPEARDALSLQIHAFDKRYLDLDELSAPLVPVVALLHFLTALATSRTKMRRFSFAWSLAAESIRLATFSCMDSWPLIGLLIISTLPPYVELINRGKPTRVYVLHMAFFVGLLLLGGGLIHSNGDAASPPSWAVVSLTAGILIRCGTIPVHCWLTDWFEHASFGNALLYVVPLTGIYAMVRLVVPIAPDWILLAIVLVSLATAIYAAGMACVQREMRRFFAYLFLSHSSLVLVGLTLVGIEPHASIALTGALSLWFAVILSLGGFGLTLRALEARFSRLTLADYHGLYDSVPTLAVFFLLTGLASVGFPGTLGFVCNELLVDGAVEANPFIGVAVVATAAINGIAVLRAYFLLFTGRRHASTVSLSIGMRERVAVLTLSALILGGGLFPQPGVFSRYLAAEEILYNRNTKKGSETDASSGKQE